MAQRSTLAYVANIHRLSRRPIPLAHTITPQIRYATDNAAKYKRSKAAKAQSKKRKTNPNFDEPDLKQAVQFTLVDAMRYIRAFEVGRDPKSAKYEIAVRLRTVRSGPVVRNRMRLPTPVSTDTKICVICPPDSKQAKTARDLGAVLVGEEEVFEKVKAEEIDFDRCICHIDSQQKLNKAGLGRVLGPRGLMPSSKTGTVVKDVGALMRDLVGGSEYRERQGVIRMAVGQLGFSPEQVQKNVKAFMDSIKKDCNILSDRVSKEVHEVVLSSTISPGFSLNGDFRGPDSLDPAILARS